MGSHGGLSSSDEESEEFSGSESGSGIANVGRPDVGKGGLGSGDRVRLPLIRIRESKNRGTQEDGKVVVEKVAGVGIGSSEGPLVSARESALGKSFEGLGIAGCRGPVHDLSVFVRWGERKKRVLVSRSGQRMCGNPRINGFGFGSGSNCSLNNERGVGEVSEAVENVSEGDDASEDNGPAALSSSFHRSADAAKYREKSETERAGISCIENTKPGRDDLWEKNLEVAGRSRSSKSANSVAQSLELNAGVSADQNIIQEFPTERERLISSEQNINKVGGSQASSNRVRFKIKYKKVTGQDGINPVASAVANASSTETAGLVGDHRNLPSQNKTPGVSKLCANENIGDEETRKQLQFPDRNSSKVESYPATSTSDVSQKMKDEAGNLRDPILKVQEEEQSLQNRRAEHELAVVNSVPDDPQINVRCLLDSHDAMTNSFKDFPFTGELTGSTSRERTDDQSCASRSYKIDSLSGHGSFDESKESKKCGIKIKTGPLTSSNRASVSDILTSSDWDKLPKWVNSGKRGTRRGIGRRQMESQQKTISKTKVEDSVPSKEVSCNNGYRDKTDNEEETIHNINKTPVDVSSSNLAPCSDMEQNLSSSKAWVSCDYCHKWRQISPSLLESIKDCRWVCKDNMDIAFSDCSVPQEKSNAEINVELGVSDSSDNEDPSDDLKEIRLKLRTDPFDGYIKSNIFRHRRRKTQNIDEIMVCLCKAPQDGSLGCGRKCLNRVLNYECVQGMCPCGDLCSNQQFQKRQWANLELFYSGKKGYGLRSREDIFSGQFLIEYVGEVLDMHAYIERQNEYAEKGHKHFYFMTVDGNEVIDSYARGNLARYINHSCEPNCTTEKWTVNGEVAVGLFAIRDIKKGEELTFDYKYQRVPGAAAQKCYCGSSKCRGYLGGEPLNSEIVVQGDSNEKYPEPAMLHRDDKIGVSLDSEIIKNDSSYGEESQNAEFDIARQSRTTIKAQVITKESASAVVQFQNSMNVKDLTEFSTYPQPSEKLLQMESSTGKQVSSAKQKISVVEETMKKLLLPTQGSEISPFSSDFKADRILKSDAFKENLDSRESRPCANTSRTFSSANQRKTCSTMNGGKALMMADKSMPPPLKSKISAENFTSGHFEAVETRLNELLDTDGGISKRKGATKGYLKLLLLTVISGGSCTGEAIQSTRELSMIIDALLKTKSRVVLTDIIRKNGLRMLHNIMKQYRGDFKKTPVLRKLLKVLEYLAKMEILTLEHINEGPPCPGMESFRDSMLSLAEHEDREVHQIARKFRDRWIPRSHKSRFDQPPVCDFKQDEVDKSLHENVPPGFTSCMDLELSHSLRTNGCRPRFSAVVAPGHLMEKFNSRLPVSYGIPLDIVAQFGSPGTGGEDWLIAPGIPFNPFPPLPQFPHDEKDLPPRAAKHLKNVQTGGQGDNHGPTACHGSSLLPDVAAIGKRGSNVLAASDGSMQLPTSAIGGQWGSCGPAPSDGIVRFPTDIAGGQWGGHSLRGSDGGIRFSTGATGGHGGSHGLSCSDGNTRLPVGGTGGQGSQGLFHSDGSSRLPAWGTGGHGSLACPDGGIRAPAGGTGGHGSQGLARSDGAIRLPAGGGIGGQQVNQGLACFDGSIRVPAGDTGGKWGNHGVSGSDGGIRLPRGATAGQCGSQSFTCPPSGTERQQRNHEPADANVEFPCDANKSGTEGPTDQHDHKRAREFSGDHETRHPKQQKGKRRMVGPPWVWRKNVY